MVGVPQLCLLLLKANTRNVTIVAKISAYVSLFRYFGHQATCASPGSSGGGGGSGGPLEGLRVLDLTR